MEEIFGAADLERLHRCCDVVWGQNDRAPNHLVDSHREELFAVVAPTWRYGELSSLPNLKAILEVGGRHPSADVLDYDYCHEHRINVLSCSPAFGPMVAEMAVGMVIDAARDITVGHNAFTTGEEKYLWDGNQETFTLYGKRIGLIGVGGLGNALMPLLRPFDVEFVGYDPWRTDDFIRSRGVESLGLEELLATSDVIYVLAIPSRENRALLNREKLSHVQKHAIFALISRSHLVDFDDLTELLFEKRFRAVIDVFPEEPMPKEHPIRSAPNVILSAHRAGSVKDDSNLIGKYVVDDLEALVQCLPAWRMQRAEQEVVVRLP